MSSIVKNYMYKYRLNHSRTRHGSSGLDLSLNSAQTSTFRESLFVCIFPLWELLPLAIHIAACTSAFKSLLKSLLFDSPQYIQLRQHLHMAHNMSYLQTCQCNTVICVQLLVYMKLAMLFSHLDLNSVYCPRKC